jgi:hypothetical protein
VTAAPPPKICATCGRRIEWRAKWARDWDEVRYCSARCRRGLRAVDQDLEHAIVAMLAQRAGGATICPSEAARAVGGDEWRELMEPARAAARRLVAAGEVEITQRGRVVDPSHAKGPIRLRRTSRVRCADVERSD